MVVLYSWGIGGNRGRVTVEASVLGGTDTARQWQSALVGTVLVTCVLMKIVVVHGTGKFVGRIDAQW